MQARKHEYQQLLTGALWVGIGVGEAVGVGVGGVGVAVGTGVGEAGGVEPPPEGCGTPGVALEGVLHVTGATTSKVMVEEQTGSGAAPVASFRTAVW